MSSTEPKRPRVDIETATLPNEQQQQTDNNTAKRQRCHADTAATLLSQDALSCQEPLEPISSVASSLSVPVSLIFRCAPQTAAANSNNSHQKPLLSRAEAQTFLTVTLLAQEIDTLVSLSAAALKQKHMYMSVSQRLQQVDNPYLRPLLPLLQVMSHDIPNYSLSFIRTELERIVSELAAATVSLRQFSEQNWTLSESLIDNSAGGNGAVLARDKRRLSDVQEETCNRIDTLLSYTTSAPDCDDKPSATSNSSVNADDASSSLGDLKKSMKEYCEQAFDMGDTSGDGDDAPVNHDTAIMHVQSESPWQADAERKPAGTPNLPSAASAARSENIDLSFTAETPNLHVPLQQEVQQQHQLPSLSVPDFSPPPPQQSSLSLPDSSSQQLSATPQMSQQPVSRTRSSHKPAASRSEEKENMSSQEPSQQQQQQQQQADVVAYGSSQASSSAVSLSASQQSSCRHQSSSALSAAEVLSGLAASGGGAYTQKQL